MSLDVADKVVLVKEVRRQSGHASADVRFVFQLGMTMFGRNHLLHKGPEPRRGCG